MPPRSRPTGAFYLPGSRFWELALGAALALGRYSVPARVPRWLTSIAGLAAIAVASFAFDRASPYPGWRALVPTLGACLVILAGERATPNRVLLGSRPFVALGLVSYPLYLWHWPLLSFGNLVENQTPSASVRLALVSGAVVLASLTYLVERALRARRATLAQAVTLATCLVVIGASGRIIAGADGFPGRFPAAVRELLAYRYDYLADAHAGECWLSVRDPVSGFRASCFPAAEARPVLFLWGDSHAARLRPGLERVAPEYAIGSATRDLCPPVLDAPGTCGASNQEILAKLEAKPPAIVVLFANWSDPSIGALPGLGQRLVVAGVRRVIILGPAPHWSPNLPVAMYEAWSHGTVTQPIPRRSAQHLDRGVFALDQRMRAMPWSRGVELVSVLDRLCDPAGCATYVPGTDALTAYDYGHLTTEGATFVARGLSLGP